MKKWPIYKLIIIILTFLILNNGYTQEIKLIKITHLSHYPSASTLEFYNRHLYVIGDDARQMLILDKDHSILDSITLFKGEGRIPKNKKADIESTFLLEKGGKFYLAAFGSLSTKERNKILLIDITKKEENKIIILPDIKHASNNELNIEGTALVRDVLLLSNRANHTNPINTLWVTTFDTEKGINEKNIKLIDIIFPATQRIVGISSISYIPNKDLLLFAGSTEDTHNAYKDGDIGDSYIGYIKDISKKLNQPSIKPDFFINVSKYLKSNQPQKIESIALESQINNDLTFHLAADNDDGKSTLFKLKWKLN